MNVVARIPIAVACMVVVARARREKKGWGGRKRDGVKAGERGGWGGGVGGRGGGGGEDRVQNIVRERKR